jgi:hypothetical protein
MPRPKALPSPTDPVLRRAEELDALDAILPFGRRNQLAVLLTDDDVATLKHLAKEGMGDNTLRALASDLGYLEAWCGLATGAPLPWPAPESLALKFVAHHLWDPIKRAEDPNHGMPAEVEIRLRTKGLLRADGPHAPDTVRGAPAPDLLVDPDTLAGPDRTLFSSVPQNSAQAGRAGQCTTKAAQEQKGGHRRGAGKAVSHLHRRSPGRSARSRPVPDRLRLWRSPALRNSRHED